MKKLTIKIGLESLCRSFPTPSLVICYLITALFSITDAGTSYAQPQHYHRLSGTIYSAENHKPLSGATISIKNKQTTVTTDELGKFTINSSDLSGTLSISYVGFQQIDLKFTPASNDLKIFLVPVTSQIREIIVSTGFQKLSKERVTGSFFLADSTLIQRRVSSDIISRLEGVVPGLLFNRNTVTSSGNQLDLSIRGHSTLFSNDQPLVVVDNFPYDGDINNINPNDVASITILKDAAAASIWGVRSGNGVIVITTKRGKITQKLEVEFNSNFTSGDKPNVYYDPNYLNANDFINVEQGLYNQGFYNRNINSGYRVISPVVQILAGQKNGTITPDAAKSMLDALRNNDVRQDIDRYLYRRSALQQYNISFKGGGENTEYYSSFGFDKNITNLAGNAIQRITATNNLIFHPLKNLEMSGGWMFNKNNGTSNSTLSALNRPGGTYGQIYPYAELAGESGDPLAIVHGFPFTFINSAVNSKYLDWSYKPLNELNYADNESKGIDNRLTAGIRYTVATGLAADIKYVYETATSNQSNYYDPSTYFVRNLVNMFTQTNSDSRLSYPIPMGGIFQESASTLSSHHFRGQLDFNREWNKNTIALITGTEWSSAVNELHSSATAYGYNKNTGALTSAIDYFTNYPLNPRQFGTGQIPNTQAFGKTTDNYVSYFANGSYTYNGKYSISVSGRIDKSNLFGVSTNQKAVPLYSAGLSWNIGKESFYNFAAVPNLKLRATFGYNGNVNKSASAITTLLQLNNSYYSNLNYNNIQYPGNPNLGWEKDRMINFALDFASKRQVITGSIEYYLKKGDNLFGNAPLPPTTGFTQYFGNTASTKGHGLEVTINSRNIEHQYFKWSTNFLLTYSRDIVSRYNLPNDVTTYLTQAEGNGGVITPIVGAPLFGIYSLKSGPLAHDTGDPQGYLNGDLSTDYTAIINQARTADLKFFGSSRPTTFGSIRNTITYEAFSLSANLIFKLGYSVRKSSINYGALFNSWIGNKDFAGRWQKPGDETRTTVPSMPTAPVSFDRETFYTFSEALVENGNHLRFQDISLSYDLTKNLWRNSPFTSFSIYAYINNIGILWRANHDGIDPDVYSAPGGNQTSLPLPRTYAIGIKSTFK